MNKHFITFVIAILLIAVGLSGCTNEQNNNEIDPEMARFVGNWKEMGEDISGQTVETGQITFSNDGAGQANITFLPENFNYNLSNGRIYITMLGDETPVIFNYTFTNNDSELTLAHITIEVLIINLVKDSN